MSTTLQAVNEVNCMGDAKSALPKFAHKLEFDVLS
jgi:hypothetical protein